MHLSAILFLSLFLIGPGPLSFFLFRFPFLFFPLQPSPSWPFLPLPHGPIGPASPSLSLPVPESGADACRAEPRARTPRFPRRPI
jgi:hypothetical protein